MAHEEIELQQKAAILLGWEVKCLSSELPDQWEIERGIDKTISKVVNYIRKKIIIARVTEEDMEVILNGAAKASSLKG